MQAGTCNRCQGLMVQCFTDSLLLEITETAQSPSWHCVNCGEWIHETIEANRRRNLHANSLSRVPKQPSAYRGWGQYATADGSRRSGLEFRRRS